MYPLGGLRGEDSEYPRSYMTGLYSPWDSDDHKVLRL